MDEADIVVYLCIILIASQLVLLSESVETGEGLGHGQGTSSSWYNSQIRYVSATENSISCFA